MQSQSERHNLNTNDTITRILRGFHDSFTNSMRHVIVYAWCEVELPIHSYTSGFSWHNPSNTHSDSCIECKSKSSAMQVLESNTEQRNKLSCVYNSVSIIIGAFAFVSRKHSIVGQLYFDPVLKLFVLISRYHHSHGGSWARVDCDDFKVFIIRTEAHVVVAD